LLKANEDRRRVFSSKIKVRAIGGPVMDLRARVIVNPPAITVLRDQAGVISALALIRMQARAPSLSPCNADVNPLHRGVRAIKAVRLVGDLPGTTFPDANQNA
jgi:hypothetical protein